MKVSEYKYGIIGAARRCDIEMFSGDSVMLTYKDPHGKEHTLNITTQHLVMFAEHEQSGAAMIMRPSIPTGVQYLPPSK